MKKSILILEDDANLGLILSEQLESNGFTVKLCRDGMEGSAESALTSYDLLLVDIMMPKKDGFTFVKELRKKDSATPVIFLTAKSLKEDRIEGFKIGCDDYITKPFSLEELLLRIKAVLRRTSPVHQQDDLLQEFEIGRYLFNSQKQLLQFGNKKFLLTARESDLLKLLCLHTNKILERESALKAIWGDDSYFNARSMDVYISKLRKYLGSDSTISIQNIHSKGYKLVVGK